MRRLLVTGAAGRVARLVVPELATTHELTLLDRPGAPLDDLAMHGEIVEMDLVDPAARRLFDGQHAVLHLAGNPDQTASFEDLLGPNVIACQAVFAHAVDAGCERVVFASSVHAVGGYPAEDEPISASAAPRPGNTYGATKAFGEALGHMVGAKTSTSVVNLRIAAAGGSPDWEDTSRIELAPDDLRRFVTLALTAPVERSATINACSIHARLDIHEGLQA